MILDKIVQVKQIEIDNHKSVCPLPELLTAIEGSPVTRDFYAALKTGSELKLIAEVKKASPSKGIIRPDFEPVSLAQSYCQGGAAAISVLTDEQFFQGSLSYLGLIREHVALPLLRKDFILDPYQLYQSRAAGADSVLLIARILSQGQLTEYISLARELGMEPLVEIHSREDLAKSLEAGAKIIGINNRDLATFQTDLGLTLELAKDIPKDCLIVSESGIREPEDLRLLAGAGVKAVLVGEALAREEDVVAATFRLLGGR